MHAVAALPILLRVRTPSYALTPPARFGGTPPDSSRRVTGYEAHDTSSCGRECNTCFCSASTRTGQERGPARRSSDGEPQARQSGHQRGRLGVRTSLSSILGSCDSFLKQRNMTERCLQARGRASRPRERAICALHQDRQARPSMRLDEQQLRASASWCVLSGTCSPPPFQLCYIRSACSSWTVTAQRETDRICVQGVVTAMSAAMCSTSRWTMRCGARHRLPSQTMRPARSSLQACSLRTSCLQSARI